MLNILSSDRKFVAARSCMASPIHRIADLDFRDIARGLVPFSSEVVNYWTIGFSKQ
jgi:hypothetical protein